MEEQWLELKETITEMRDNGGTGTQQEVCQYLINLMNVLEKQIQGSCEDCYDGAQNEKAKLCQKSYLAGMEHYKNLHSCDNVVCRQALLAKAEKEAKGMYDPFRHGLVPMIQGLLHKLPPVRPQSCGDCISRKEAILQIQRYGVGCLDPEDFSPETCERFVIQKLNELPPAVPGQPSCEDCSGCGTKMYEKEK